MCLIFIKFEVEFLRCNAAGIVDLRNLAARKDEQKNTYGLNDAVKQQPGLEYLNTKLTKPSMKKPNSDELPFETKYDKNLKNLDDLLVDYISFSKKINKNKNEDNILKKIQEFSGGLPVGSSAYTITFTTPSTTPTTSTTSSTTTTKETTTIKSKLIGKNSYAYEQLKNKIEQYKAQNANKNNQIPNTDNLIMKLAELISTFSTKSTTTARPTTMTTTTTTTTSAKITSVTNKIPSIARSSLLPRKSSDKITKTNTFDYNANSNIVYDWFKAYQEKYNAGK